MTLEPGLRVDRQPTVEPAGSHDALNRNNAECPVDLELQKS